MTHDQLERDALLELWRDWPETRPELGHPDNWIQWTPHADPLGFHIGDMKDCGDWTTTYGGTRTHHEVAALSRDRLTALLIGEGYHRFEWASNSYEDLITLTLYSHQFEDATELLALIKAYRATK